MENMSELSAAERIQYNRKHGVDPEEYLIEAGVARETDDDRKLAFTDEFADLAREYVNEVAQEGATEADLATIFNVYEDDVTEMEDRDYTAYKILYIIRKWPSERALELDIALDRALHEWADWREAVPPRQRHRILGSLRSFQDRCFFCDGPMIFNEEVVQSCCGDQDVVTIYCDGCEERFVEFLVGEQQSDVDVSVEH